MSNLEHVEPNLPSLLTAFFQQPGYVVATP